MNFKKTVISVFAISSLLLLLSCSSKSKNKRIVIIGLDGLSVEGYQKSKHPNLDSLMKDGILSLNTRCVMPSVTLPNWTSHLTSGGPEQHGVTSNSWRIDNQILSPIEKDDLGYYPSIFKIIKEQVPNVKTGYYYNWAELINSINKKYIDELSFEENDGYLKNYNKAFDFIIDNKLHPTLIFLYSVHIDHAGHSYNWMSLEYIKSIENIDREIGNLVNKLKSSGLYASTNFLLITDHGGTRTTGHGGLSIEEMEVPWGITGPNITKGKMLTEPNSNANTAKVISTLFECNDIPKSWIGKVPKSIFE